MPIACVMCMTMEIRMVCLKQKNKNKIKYNLTTKIKREKLTLCSPQDMVHKILYQHMHKIDTQ